MIEPAVQKILREIFALSRSQKTEAYLVGGFLRDLLCRRKTSDIDLAVPKNPRLLAQKIARKFKGPLIELALEEEIYRVLLKNGVQVDVAKYKGKDIGSDLALRDFSLNALAVPLSKAADPAYWKEFPKGALDPFSGAKDIRQKTVRQISASIYKDDPLRMLRAYRIAAQLGFKLDPSTEKLIFKSVSKIQEPAKERIREEILLLLDQPESYPYVKRLDESGMISQIFPEVDANRTCAEDYYPGKGVWGHSLDGLKCLEWIFAHLESEFGENAAAMADLFFRKDKDTEGHPRSTLMKLGILFHDIGKAATAQEIGGRLRFFQHEYVGAKMARKIAERLRFSVNASRNVSGLVLAHMRPGGLAHIPELTERAKYRFFRDLGVSALPMLVVALADRYTYLEPKDFGKRQDLHERVTKELIEWHFLKERQKPANKTKLIDGNILMKALKLKPGPLIGKILKELDEAAGTGEIRTKAQAIAAAKKYLNEPS